MRRARAGDPGGLWIAGWEQTKGRGRQGRVWYSPHGNLAASLLLIDPAPTNLAPQLGFVAGVALAEAARDLLPVGKPAQLKWPNDLVVGRRKLAGLLVERPSAQVAVVGVGLNLAARWEGDLADQRTSLTDHGAPLSTDTASQITALTAIRRYLLEASGLLRAGSFAQLLPTLRERDVLRGHEVGVENGHRVHRGTATGIDGEGHLLIEGLPIVSGTITSW